MNNINNGLKKFASFSVLFLIAAGNIYYDTAPWFFWVLLCGLVYLSVVFLLNYQDDVFPGAYCSGCGFKNVECMCDSNGDTIGRWGEIPKKKK